MKKYKKLPVVSGAGRGKKIGVPTINLDPSNIDLDHGIYVCKVTFPGQSFWGVAHFGPRPTFGEDGVTLEAYLFNFGFDVRVPKDLDLEVFDYIRPVKQFESVKLMVAEIDNDVVVAKKKIHELSS